MGNTKAAAVIANHYSAPIHYNFCPKSIQLNSLSEKKTPKYIDQIGQKRLLGSSARVQSVLPYNALKSWDTRKLQQTRPCSSTQRDNAQNIHLLFSTFYFSISHFSLFFLDFTFQTPFSTFHILVFAFLLFICFLFRSLFTCSTV